MCRLTSLLLLVMVGDGVVRPKASKADALESLRRLDLVRGLAR